MLISCRPGPFSCYAGSVGNGWRTVGVLLCTFCLQGIRESFCCLHGAQRLTWTTRHNECWRFVFQSRITLSEFQCISTGFNLTALYLFVRFFVTLLKCFVWSVSLPATSRSLSGRCRQNWGHWPLLWSLSDPSHRH